MLQVFKKLLMFILHIVWELLKVTNKSVSHNHAELLVTNTGKSWPKGSWIVFEQ